MNTTLCKAILEYMKEEPYILKNFMEELKIKYTNCFAFHDAGMVLPSKTIFVDVLDTKKHTIDGYSPLIDFLETIDCDIAQEFYFKFEDYYYFINYLFDQLVNKDNKENRLTAILDVFEELEIDFITLENNLEKKYTVGIITDEYKNTRFTYQVQSDGTLIKDTVEGIVRYENPNYILKTTKSGAKTTKRILVKSLDLSNNSLNTLKKANKNIK